MIEKLGVINLRVRAEWLRRIDVAVELRPVKTSRHAWIMEAIYHQLQRETAEGTLDIFWENSEDHAAAPKYRLIFCRYIRFTGGAMQPHRVVGDAALKRHLIDLNFTEEDVEAWLGKVKAERSVPIPNVVLQLRHLADYGYGSSRLKTLRGYPKPANEGHLKTGQR